MYNQNTNINTMATVHIPVTGILILSSNGFISNITAQLPSHYLGIVTYLVSKSEIESTEIALLVCGKGTSAMILGHMINKMDSKDSLVYSESKGQTIHITLLRSSEAPQQCGRAVHLSNHMGFSYNSSGSC